MADPIRTNISLPNVATSDGRLLPVARHYYHMAFNFRYAAATQLFTLQPWTAGPYSGQYARVVFEGGSGDDTGTAANSGYSDTIPGLTQDSIVFTDARKGGALSSQYVQLVQAIGLQLTGHGRRLPTIAPTQGVSLVPFGAEGEYNPLDEAVADAMFSAVIKGLECQLLPSNQTSQCAAFLGNCFMFCSGTGIINSGVPSLGTPDRRGSYALGSDLLLLPNPDNSNFRPNRLLFSKPEGTNAVTVRDIPGAAARADGEFALDIMVFVDSANVILGMQSDKDDPNTFVRTDNPNKFNSIQPASTRDATMIECGAGWV